MCRKKTTMENIKLIINYIKNNDYDVSVISGETSITTFFNMINDIKNGMLNETNFRLIDNTLGVVDYVKYYQLKHTQNFEFMILEDGLLINIF